MPKNVLLSVKPAFANLLVDGLKTIELRRKFPQDLTPGTKVYIYASAPTKQLIGECEIAAVEKLSLNDLWLKASSEAMLGWEDFLAYFRGNDFGFAIHVQGQVRYSQPIPMVEMKKKISNPPQSYCYVRECLAAL